MGRAAPGLTLQKSLDSTKKSGNLKRKILVRIVCPLSFPRAEGSVYNVLSLFLQPIMMKKKLSEIKFLRVIVSSKRKK